MVNNKENSGIIYFQSTAWSLVNLNPVQLNMETLCVEAHVTFTIKLIVWPPPLVLLL
jgi:hypothetical protein